MASETVRITVDTLAFAVGQGSLEVLLVKRKYEPFKSFWALPGGFILDSDHSLEDAATRELYEETNVSNVYLEQLYTFGDKGRDPRGRVVTVAHLALLLQEKLELRASTDASGVAWWPISELPSLAFDHEAIVHYGYQRLKYKVEYTPAAFKLLPEKFTLRDLQTVYEAILAKPVDNRNFRKKFLSSGVLQELNETSQEGSYRPARLYCFSEQDFEKLPDRPVFVF
ncbi:MAG: NUDIX hydrolase [Candidatus Obscuribacterales bacterium]|nr:NUDIX hydrolase [Candidatus Obscuribacterales bacterium]